MTDREYSVVEAIGRINRFADSHLTAFPTASQAAKDFARLGVISNTLKPSDSKPGVPASPGTLARQELIDDLWDDLLAIADTARTIARKEPGFAADFRVGDDSQRQIIATATAFHEKLQDADIAAKFFAYLMPADFVTELHTTLEKIDGKKDEQTDDQLEDVTETAETRALIKEARELIKSLNTSVKNLFRRDPLILTEWRTASRIHRTSARKKEENEPPSAPPTPDTPA